MSEAYLSLGSNMGDRLDNLARAVALLDRQDGSVTVVQVSPVFETSSALAMHLALKGE